MAYPVKLFGSPPCCPGIVEFEFDEESVAVGAAPELVEDPVEDAPEVEAADEAPEEDEVVDAAAPDEDEDDDDEEEEDEGEDEVAADELEELE